VVLGGAGTAFCAGADLNWMKRMAGYGYEQNLADARALASMLKTLDRMSKPTIARVHGPAFAGGVGGPRRRMRHCSRHAGGEVLPFGGEAGDFRRRRSVLM
jgi:hypothetical protein